MNEVYTGLGGVYNDMHKTFFEHEIFDFVNYANVDLLMGVVSIGSGCKEYLSDPSG